MSQKYRFVRKVKRWEEKEFEIELPFYGKYHFDYSVSYVRIDEKLRETTVTINNDCITDYGNHQNPSCEIELQEKSDLNYSSDFFDCKSNEEEYKKAIAYVLEFVEKAK
jgi:hypothetical protein